MWILSNAEMSYDVAVNFTNSWTTFLAGNKGLVEAFEDIDNLNVKTVAAQQKNEPG